MKIIAHRNETPGCPENSVESLEYSAQEGIFAVECDVRRTGDGVYVIYHDDTLERLTGVKLAVADITLARMRAVLAERGRAVLTLNDLIARYSRPTPVLLHIKEQTPRPDLIDTLKNARVEFIFGVESIEMLNALTPFTPRDHLLAFMPQPDMYPEFIKNGIGIIRLWEQWLDFLTPDTVRAAGAPQVWIMCCTKEHGMDGSPESLDRLVSLKADGALVSDVAMGVAWLKARQATQI